MAFFSAYPPTVSQPKVRQEGFHLPSPTHSNGNNPPSPPPGSNPFDLLLSSQHHHSGQHNSGLPDVFSRNNVGSMDFSDDLASLIAASSPSATTSSERSTHQDMNPNSESYRPPHNIFDISAPPSHYSHQSHNHAFSLPHTGHRPDLMTPLSQPSSFHSTFDTSMHNHSIQQQQHHPGLGRDGFQGHFNSTIPPLSSHTQDPNAPPVGSPQSVTTPSQHQHMFGSPFMTQQGSAMKRDTPSPSSTTASARPGTSGGRRGREGSTSRSRSRAEPSDGGVKAEVGSSVASGSGTGPTRTTKSTSRRRDSLSMMHPHPHSHSHSHSFSHSRPQAITIPSQNSVHSLHNGIAGATPQSAGGVRTPISPLGHSFSHGPPQSSSFQQTPGAQNGSNSWYLPQHHNSLAIGIGIANGHSGHGSSAAGIGEFSLPTPESVSGTAGGPFGYGGNGMGISPKETTLMSSSVPGMGVLPNVGSPPGNTSSSSTAGAKSEDLNSAASKQAALVNEKRRRRRESHNAVERRRRDNINEKISELATLIPEVMLDPSGGMNGGAGVSADDMNGLETLDEPVCTGTSTGNRKDKKGDKDKSHDSKDQVQGGESTQSPGADGSGDGREGSSGTGAAGGGGPIKANKGMILRKSVEYIRYLQQLVDAQAARNRELEEKLARVTGGMENLSTSTTGKSVHEQMALLGIGRQHDTMQQHGLHQANGGGHSQSSNGTDNADGSNGDMNVGGVDDNFGLGSSMNELLGLHTFGPEADDSEFAMGFGVGVGVGESHHGQQQQHPSPHQHRAQPQQSQQTPTNAFGLMNNVNSSLNGFYGSSSSTTSGRGMFEGLETMVERNEMEVEMGDGENDHSMENRQSQSQSTPVNGPNGSMGTSAGNGSISINGQKPKRGRKHSFSGGVTSKTSSSFSRGSVSVERKKRPTSRSLSRRGERERNANMNGRREASLAAVREYSESGIGEEDEESVLDGTDGDDADVDADVDVKGEPSPTASLSVSGGGSVSGAGSEGVEDQDEGSGLNGMDFGLGGLVGVSEEERGRKGRDGKVSGFTSMDDVRVIKTEVENDGMEE